MIKGFEKITKEEFATLRDALPMIAALVGGADGNYDHKEREWAQKIADIYNFSKGAPLDIFFHKVSDKFSEKSDALFRQHQDTTERNAFLSTELAKLNDIFPKLRPLDAYEIYRSFMHFADEVAKASGGILRMGSINANEKKWTELSMIDPLTRPPGLDPAF